MAEREIPSGVRERLGIGGGLTLVQMPYSPYCIPIRVALEAAGAPHAALDIPLWDRRPVIELTSAAYYTVPVLVDADRSPAAVIYESRDDGTEVPRYVDARFGLHLFPQDLEGIQDIVVRYVENDVEDVAFRLHDAFALPRVADTAVRGMLIRHKERKFGKGCIDQWAAQVPALREKLVDVLTPLERALASHRFLLGERVTYADYALYGVLGCLTFTGDNELPRETPNILRWHEALQTLRLDSKATVTA